MRLALVHEPINPITISKLIKNIQLFNANLKINIKATRVVLETTNIQKELVHFLHIIYFYQIASI